MLKLCCSSSEGNGLYPASSDLNQWISVSERCVPRRIYIPFILLWQTAVVVKIVRHFKTKNLAEACLTFILYYFYFNTWIFCYLWGKNRSNVCTSMSKQNFSIMKPRFSRISLVNFSIRCGPQYSAHVGVISHLSMWVNPIQQMYWADFAL